MSPTMSVILVATGMLAIFLIITPSSLFAPIPMNLRGERLWNATAPSPPIGEPNGSESFSTWNHTEQMEVSGDASTSAKNKSGSCGDGDLYHGKWVYDQAGPLYRSGACPLKHPSKSCRRNGTLGGDHENWRWKPDLCDLPRFDAEKFLELMKGKTLVFAGDSLSRNQMESLICILWQVEVPRNLSNRHLDLWLFRSTSTTIIRIWSPFLIRRFMGHMDSVPNNAGKLHLDTLDEIVMELFPKADVAVLSCGHWFAKRSAYFLNDTVVGGHLWSPDESRKMQIDNVEAFRVSMDTVLSAVATHPNFTGLAIFRSISPSHFEGGDWNNGGTCAGMSGPSSESIRTGFEDAMYKVQVTAFKKAVELAKKNRSRLRLMDITAAFGYRRDGHPGPSYSPGRQDCLHWCLPGPIDTWNEILMEIIRREFEGACMKDAQ